MQHPARTLIALLVLLAIAVVGCSSAEDATDTTVSGGDGGADTEISIVNFAFEPSTITVSVGEEVTWTNTSSATHTTTSDDGSWNAQLAGGQTLTRTFDAAGTFEYFCSIHPSMTGTITVDG